jgi:hypothetical protein
MRIAHHGMAGLWAAPGRLEPCRQAACQWLAWKSLKQSQQKESCGLKANRIEGEDNIMHHTCTRQTDLDELIGTECWENQRLEFHYGPLPLAMEAGEELVLDDIGNLSPILRAKLPVLLRSLTIEETNQVIHPGLGFRVTYN